MGKCGNPGTARAVAPEKLLRELQQRIEALAHERDLLERICHAKSLEQLLEVVGESVAGFESVDGYLINLVDESGDHLICEKVMLPAEYASVLETYLYFKFPLSETDANVVSFRSRQPVKVDIGNVENFPGTTKTRFYRWRIRSLLVAPIFRGDDCLGTVMVFSQNQDLPLTRADEIQTRVQGYAEPIANALDHTRLRRKARLVESATEEQRQFLRFITKVNNINSMERICEEISLEFLRRMPFDLVGVVTREQDKLVMRRLTLGDARYQPIHDKLLPFYRDNPFLIDQADGALPTAFMQNSNLYFPDALEILNLPMSPKDRQALALMESPRTIFMSPIRRKDAPVGVLLLVSLGKPVPMSQQEKEFIEMLCSFIGTAMGNAELYEIIAKQNAEIEALNADLQGRVETLGHLASTDRLTGLHNFGYFETELNRRVEEYRRCSNDKLSLVIFDVDHFKRFNDTYGHLAGNEVLQRVAQQLHQLVRSMDLACRYGGEEFVVLLPHCDLEGARGFAERVRTEILATPLFPADPDLLISVSAGCATYIPGESSARLIERSDQALYRAKSEGRNRVALADPVPAPAE